MTWKEIRDECLQLMYSYSKKGAVIPPSDGNNMDYIMAMPGAANLAMYEVLRKRPLVRRCQVVQSVLPLCNTTTADFDMVTHAEGDVVREYRDGRAWYFEVGGPAVVVVQDLAGAELERVENASQGFCAYRGLADGFALRFTGAYPYSIRNVCAYACTFPSREEIPPFAPYRAYDARQMAAQTGNRFLRFADEVLAYEGNFSDGKRYVEGHKNFIAPDGHTIRLDYFDEGQFDVYYHAAPAEITAETPDDFAVELDADAAKLVPLRMASYLYKDDDETVAAMLYNEFVNDLAELSADKPHGGHAEFVNTTGWY